ncbi:DUF1080 domain-containing protein [Nibricoccus sp. IMCC34717]|uniref:3-keto-disaccharide hydrolase n=1 Tax=Nibricoccus sp. IMCC34717 TaxID=3034021 RepID=UPI00384C4C55
MTPKRLVVAAAIAAAFLSNQAHAGPWRDLFNGKDLTGWKQVNGTAPYRVEDGAIVGRTVVGSPNSFLATEETFTDFILELEVKLEPDRTFNSGVQFRSASTPDFQNGRVHGYQCEIDPSDRGYTGGIYEEALRGWLYPLAKHPQALRLLRIGEWNRLRIEAIGPDLRTWVNGHPAANLRDNARSAGLFALQVHSIDNADQAGREVRWRALRIQTTELSLSPTEAPLVDLSASKP